jgi:hypothetical protein
LKSLALPALAAMLVTACATTGAMADQGGAPAQEKAGYDLNTPEGVLGAQRRIWCTETDGQPVYWSFTGEAYSRRQGEKDQLLFKVYGYNTRSCG